MAAENGAYALIERRDIDDLRDTMSALNRTVIMLGNIMRELTEATREHSSLLRSVVSQDA